MESVGKRFAIGKSGKTDLSSFCGMMNNPQLAAMFLGLMLRDTARLTV
jgi:hypothetical protein